MEGHPNIVVLFSAVRSDNMTDTRICAAQDTRKPHSLEPLKRNVFTFFFNMELLLRQILLNVEYQNGKSEKVFFMWLLQG